jgi:hypothetical protein
MSGGRPVLWLTLACAVMLAACAKLGSSSTFYPQESVVAEANVYPHNYRSEIVSYLRTYLNDPTGIRAAFIAEPSLKQLVRAQRYAVCLRFNAKKSTGEYEGSRDRLVVFTAGRLDTMIPARPEHCAGAAWQPFGELERLTR